MKRGMIAAVLFFFSSVSNGEMISEIKFSLNTNHQDYLYSSTNAEIYNTGDIVYWRSIQKNVLSEVIYHFPVDGNIRWANIASSYNNGEMLNLDIRSIFEISSSKDNIHYNSFNYCYLGAKCYSHPRDITRSVGGSKDIFIRARWSTTDFSNVGVDSVKFLPINSWDLINPSIKVRAETNVPEPNIIIYAILLTIYFSCKNKR